MRWPLLPPVVLILVGLLAPAQGSVALRASVEDLTGAAATVVRGEVRERRVTMAPGRGVIWTRFEIRVQKTLVGEKRRTVTLRVRGGRHGSIHGSVVQETLGGPDLRVGDRVVAFLRKDADGELRVLGLAQGVFKVTTDPKTGKRVCTNSVAGLTLVDRKGRRQEAKPTRLNLDVLERRIADALARKQEREAERRRKRQALLAERARRARARAKATSGSPGSPPEGHDE